MSAKKPKNRNPGLAILVVEGVDGLFRLCVKSHAGISMAGWRLNRGGLFPIEEFEFFDEADAKVAQRKLQAYVTACQ